MKDQDTNLSPWLPGQITSDKPPRPPAMPMVVFLRVGSTICTVWLIALYVICFKFTNGNWPTGIKFYALAGLVLFFFGIRYFVGPVRRTDSGQITQHLSVVQMLIVIALCLSGGSFLTWFFHG